MSPPRLGLEAKPGMTTWDAGFLVGLLEVVIADKGAWIKVRVLISKPKQLQRAMPRAALCLTPNWP